MLAKTANTAWSESLHSVIKGTTQNFHFHKWKFLSSLLFVCWFITARWSSGFWHKTSRIPAPHSISFSHPPTERRIQHFFFSCLMKSRNVFYSAAILCHPLHHCFQCFLCCILLHKHFITLVLYSNL